MRLQDRRPYVVTACAVAASFVAIALARGEPDDPGRSAGTDSGGRGDPSDQARGRVGPYAPPAGTEPPDPPGAGAARRRARPVALAFVRAFLRYEQARRRSAVRRGLLRTATRRLARALLSRPVRGAAGAPQGRLVRLSLYGPFGRELKASAQIAYRGLGETLVELALQERQGQWRVARMRP